MRRAVAPVNGAGAPASWPPGRGPAVTHPADRSPPGGTSAAGSLLPARENHWSSPSHARHPLPMTSPLPLPRPSHEIRARHTPTTVTVYQAYSPRIAGPAARDQRFPAAWKRERMTWVKPSFLWMMYRSGWARKEGQERVLAVEVDRAGFDRALAGACLSAHHPGLHPDRDAWRAALRRSPARVQWDPERDWRLQPLPHRSLQLGLSGEAVRRYADEWLVSVTDVTALAHAVHERVREGDEAGARELLPPETVYVPEGGAPGWSPA